MKPIQRSRTRKTLAIGGGAAVALALVGWFLMSGDSQTGEIVTDETPAFAGAETVTPPASQPRPAAQEPLDAAPAATSSFTSGAPTYAVTLERARTARNAGNIISPANENAIELFVAAAAEAGGDPAVEAELEAVVGQALGIAESAILADNASPGGSSAGNGSLR